MNWYFALTAASIEQDDLYARCVRVAVLSALQNTDLAPCFLFDGAPCALTEWVRRVGGSVIHHRSSLSDAIMRTRPEDLHWQTTAHGAFLRIDLPFVAQEEEFVLYTDCDVMFLRQPEIDGLRPQYFAVAPEFAPGDHENMNSGVMLMNTEGMRSVAADFDRFIRDGLSGFEAFDQGALRIYFKGRYGPLPDGMNWKPYWGPNPDASIVHFHGPKPPHARLLLDGAGADLPPVYHQLYGNDPANYARLEGQWRRFLHRAVLLA